ncbi:MULTISPECIES: succinyldiaminopimelate transaminase [unclassified Luteococcus]|uniref:succinyldiaminopimelate transaminase n=1 Tax=unclassified Luteococcus TaxID=2639923 RepID=UPI00313A81D7
MTAPVNNQQHEFDGRVRQRDPLSARLPAFPWDSLADAKQRAAAHPGGICDLSVGTPVDPTPQLAIDALAAGATRWAGYPTVWGTPALRQSIIGYLERRWQARGLTERNVLPVIGTKELVAWLPTQLGLGPDDLIVIPSTAYPTYEVGAAIVGATVQRCDDPARIDGIPALVWINSPANPHGAILSPEQTRAWVDYARSVGAVLASDECYGEFGWEAEPCSVLDAEICGGSFDGLLAVHSLSKRSNMAGYRGGFIAGDDKLCMELLELRKHGGMMLPGPVQDAMVAALDDHAHVEEQRQRYLARRAILKPALEEAGFTIDHSEGSLYLWATRGEDCRQTIDWLAERGILAAPADFYGTASSQHVRIALTASDERIAAAAQRLTG